MWGRSRFLARAFVLSGVTWSAAALADDGSEGSTCAITADCARGLRCIDGVCMSVAHGRIVSPVVVRREHSYSSSDRAWIGDGEGYVLQVIIGDTVATIAAGLFVTAALATGQGAFAVASVFPTTLAAPIIHAANGRGGPAAVSFFAWASFPPTLTFFGLLAAFGTGSAGIANIVAATTFAVGIGAAVGLGALDAYFARPVNGQRTPKESFTIVPSVTPAQGGFSAGVAGSF
jgi:hypothetical protein